MQTSASEFSKGLSRSGRPLRAYLGTRELISFTLRKCPEVKTPLLDTVDTIFAQWHLCDESYGRFGVNYNPKLTYWGATSFKTTQISSKKYVNNCTAHLAFIFKWFAKIFLGNNSTVAQLYNVILISTCLSWSDLITKFGFEDDQRRNNIFVFQK